MPDISLQLDTPDLAGQRLIAALGAPPGAHVPDIGAGTGLLAVKP